MNKTLRNALNATVLAFSSTFAAVSGYAEPTVAPEPMWPALTTNPHTNKLTVRTAFSSVCTADAYEAQTLSTIAVSMKDIIKPGQELDMDELDVTLQMTQTTGDESFVRKELEKYNFDKVDVPAITKIFQEEWSARAKKYTAAQFKTSPQDVQADLAKSIIATSQKYKEQTGVMVFLEIVKGALSEAPTPDCLAAASMPKPQAQ